MKKMLPQISNESSKDFVGIHVEPSHSIIGFQSVDVPIALALCRLPETGQLSWLKAPHKRKRALGLQRTKYSCEIVTHYDF